MPHEGLADGLPQGADVLHGHFCGLLTVGGGLSGASRVREGRCSLAARSSQAAAAYHASGSACVGPVPPELSGGAIAISAKNTGFYRAGGNTALLPPSCREADTPSRGASATGTGGRRPSAVVSDPVGS